MTRNAVPRIALVLAALLTAGALPALAATQGIYRGVLRVVKFDVSPPLRTMTPKPISAGAGALMVDPDSDFEGPLGPQDLDGALVQDWIGPVLIPSPLVSFDATSNIAGFTPPDPNGDVGPTDVVVMTNVYFQIYDKTGTSLLGPLANNTLWSGFGGACEAENAGDPVVLYDQVYDRWLLTQFTGAGPTYYNCVALSTSSDPTGSYFRWAFTTGTNFPDYPKYGIWGNGIFISTREFAASFAGVGAYAIDRAQMVAGNPNPTVISFLVPPGGTPYNVGDGLLPVDVDGFAAPPLPNDEVYVGSMDNGAQYGAPQDALTVWHFHTDFATPANSSFTLAATVPIAAYDTVFDPCGGGRSCIPQPGTGARLDILSYRQRPLHRAAYRNFGDHESIVTNQSVEGVPGIAGIRWWELRDPNGTPSIFQEGTYVPGSGDSIHRWMGSIAQDSSGNMALGYSASDGTSTFPSVWYTGRLVSDTLGTMPQGEGSVIDGTGSQTSSGSRWGDYTSTTVDPTDDCTFWMVNEYVPTTSNAGWRLRVGAFRFNECGTPDFTLGATPASRTICAGSDATYTVNVGSIAGFTADVTLAASGNPGASTAGFSTNPVTPPGSSTLTISNTAAVGAGTYSIAIDGTASGSPGHSTPVDLTVLTTAPGATMLLTPADGATGVATAPTFTWTAVADAVDYLIEVDDNSDFSSPEFSATVTGTSATPSTSLAADTHYYWRVTTEQPLRLDGLRRLRVRHRPRVLQLAQRADPRQPVLGRRGLDHGAGRLRVRHRPERLHPGRPHLRRRPGLHRSPGLRRPAGHLRPPGLHRDRLRLLGRQHRRHPRRRGHLRGRGRLRPDAARDLRRPDAERPALLLRRRGVRRYLDDPRPGLRRRRHRHLAHLVPGAHGDPHPGPAVRRRLRVRRHQRLVGRPAVT